MAFELDMYPHLLDPQSVFRWSKIFITLPQRSGLESLGHSVTVGKTILSKGKVSTTDFMGFSIQPVSLNFIYSRYLTKNKSEMQSQFWSNSKLYVTDKIISALVNFHFQKVIFNVILGESKAMSGFIY